MPAPPIPETSLATDSCPLHKALQSQASTPLGVLHARIHHLMMESMREYASGEQAGVTTLMQLQTVEEEMDTLLLQAITGSRRTATGY